MKILLTISYDGTNFHGWQRQNGQITIQETLENALFSIFSERIITRGASRTDARVHALGQRATFTANTRVPMENLPLVINNKLPKDIRIMKAKYVSESFHPQYSAKNKTYCYTIYNAKIINPIYTNYAWLVKPKLNILAMENATKYLLGEHNFLAFCASGSNAKTFTRTIYNIKIKDESPNLIISITGNGFLYNMVRIIIGTLVYVGQGKLQSEYVKHILLSQDRTLAGITAPPQGLSLNRIEY